MCIGDLQVINCVLNELNVFVICLAVSSLLLLFISELALLLCTIGNEVFAIFFPKPFHFPILIINNNFNLRAG